MPLIVITGYPCSGKTHRAQQIVTDFTERVNEYNAAHPTSRPLSIQHIRSRHTVLESPNAREEIYTSANAEKTARAAEFSAIKRALNKDTIVIADSGNYIKGYRYQLWCEAKAVGTRCCVVHIAAREEEAEAWNRERAKAQGHDNINDTIEKAKGQFMDKPESHTFIYGDRLDGAEVDEDGIPESLKAKRKQDTGYGKLESDLKSLYINPKTLGSVPDDDDDTAEETEAATNNEELDSTISESKPQSEANTQEPPSFPPLASAYTVSTFHSLISRYEPPSPFTRWDTPLFTVPSADIQSPTTEIWAALFPHLVTPAQQPTSLASNLASSAGPPPSYAPSIASTRTGSQLNRPRKGETRTGRIIPHAATVLPGATSSEALQVLERGTQTVVKTVLEWAKSNTLSGTVGEDDVEIEINLPASRFQTANANSNGEASKEDDANVMTLSVPASTTLNLPALQRLRRLYVQVQRTSVAKGTSTAASGDERKVVEGFVRWMEDEFQESIGR